MTNEELNKIFQDVNSEMLAEDLPQRISSHIAKNCTNENGDVSTGKLAAALISEMVIYNNDFLFKVLSKALCKA